LAAQNVIININNYTDAYAACHAIKRWKPAPYKVFL